MSRGLYQPIMEIDNDPVYIKDDDINNIRGNRHIKLCTTVNKLYPDKIFGAQKINKIWLLYPRTNRIRVSLIVSGFTLDGKHIDVFDDNPPKIDGKRSQCLVLKTYQPHYPHMWSGNVLMVILSSR